MEIVMELTATECAQCGIPFAMPSSFMESLKQTGQQFYCPNGHSLTFGEGENAKLKKQNNNNADTIRRKNEEIESLERTNASKKGQITKLRKKLDKEVE